MKIRMLLQNLNFPIVKCYLEMPVNYSLRSQCVGLHWFENKKTIRFYQLKPSHTMPCNILRILCEYLGWFQNELLFSMHTMTGPPRQIWSRQGPIFYPNIFDQLFLIRAYWNPKSRQGPGLGGLASRGGPGPRCLCVYLGQTFTYNRSYILCI